jgi:XTP/dITP diphosphohydrolase
VPRLLVATTNAGKLREIRRILADLPYEVVSLAEIPAIDEHEEAGATFEAIARDKALYYARASGLLTVAEDSGLEIDALGGLPGITSARFPGHTYPDKFARLFAMLDARGAATSTARFVCALALVQGDRVLFETRGTVEGEITREPRGAGGFGYDPIFFYPPFGQTLAEIDEGRKASVSHRGAAFRALAQFLRERGISGSAGRGVGA